jgi:hypothetical protein
MVMVSGPRSSETDEGQDGHDDDHEADEVNDGIHENALRQLKCDISTGGRVISFRSRSESHCGFSPKKSTKTRN